MLLDKGPMQRKRLFHALMEAALMFAAAFSFRPAAGRVRGSSSVGSNCVQHCLLFALF